MIYLKDLWDDFISLLFPRICCGCGNELVRNEKVICTECILAIPRTCFHEKDDNPVSQLFWGRCKIEKATAFSFYSKGSRIRKVIHSLKYKGLRGIGPEMGKICAFSLLSSGFFSDIDIIVPVPLHPQKLRKRGFNQSEAISEGIAGVAGIPMDSVSLVRISGSGTQTRRSRMGRWENVEGIFRVERPEMFSGRHVLLVDDVITTGSTIDACATELLKIEGVKVSVVALAVAVQ